MSKLLDKIKKHKNKILVAAALAAGAGGSQLIRNHFDNKVAQKMLSAENKSHHASGLSSTLSGSAILTANYRGKMRAFNDKIKNNPNISSEDKDAVKKQFSDEYKTGMKSHLKSQLVHHGIHTGLRHLSDILINASHGSKWNSKKHATDKLFMRQQIGHIHNILSQGYQAAKAYKTGQKIFDD